MSYDPMFPTTKGILRKLGGDKISGNVLTWDGDTSGAIEVLGEWFVKIYNKYMDLSKVASVHVVDTVGASFSETVPPESLIVQTIDEDGVKGVQVLTATLYDQEVGLLLSTPTWGSAGLTEGVYVFAGTSLYRAETITFAETIVPIDPKYLPDESVTETINLAAFTTTENTDFNTVLLLSMLQSAQSGGALQTQTVHDAGNALRTACSVGRRIVLKATSTQDGHPVFVEFPIMRSMEGGVAAQLSSSATLLTNGTVLDVQTLLVFLRETDNVVVYVKATPLT